MQGKSISEKFNLSNRAKLWELASYHGSALTYGHCDALGRIRNVTSEHADRLIAAGQNVYVDIPFDTNDPNAPMYGSI